MDQTVRARAFAIESEARQAADPATAVNLLAVRVAQLESAARSEKERADRWHARSIELGEELERARRALAAQSPDLTDPGARRCDPEAGFHAMPHVGCILR